MMMWGLFIFVSVCVACALLGSLALFLVMPAVKFGKHVFGSEKLASVGAGIGS